MRSVIRTPLTVLIGAALALAGCASDAADEPAPGESTVTSGSDAGAAPDALAILDMLYPERDVPPAQLAVADLTLGDGAVATAGQRAVVQYWGVRWSDGGTFDASWERGEPFTFVLGTGQVISGWDIGVEGMQVGGRRVLVIPPDLAYGDRGVGNVIGPGETLVFVVDLVDTGAS